MKQKYVDPKDKREFNMYIHFEDLDINDIPKPWLQCYGVVLNDKHEVVLVAGDDKNWILPGGSLEAGESPENTLEREVYEEAAVQIDSSSCELFFHQEIYRITGQTEEFEGSQLRFIAKAVREDTFVNDPGGHMKFQAWIQLDQIHEYLQWGKTSEVMQEKLLERYS